MRPTIVIIVSFMHYTLVAKLTLASVAFMRQDVNQNTVPFPREVQRECLPASSTSAKVLTYRMLKLCSHGICLMSVPGLSALRDLT